MIQDAENAGGH